MKKLMLLVLIIAVLPTLASLSLPSTTNQPVYPNGLPVDINVPCAFDGAVCPASTVCNMTVLDPDSLVLVNDGVMTKNGSVFNYSLDGNQTISNGAHEVSVSCCTGSNCRNKLLSFLITPSGGDPISSGQGTVLLVIMGIMFFVGAIFFVIGFRSQTVWMKTAGYSFGAIMVLVLILYSLLVVNEVIATSPSLIEGFETFYFVMKMVGTVLIAALMVVMFLVFAKAWKIRRGLIDK